MQCPFKKGSNPMKILNTLLSDTDKFSETSLQNNLGYYSRFTFLLLIYNDKVNCTPSEVLFRIECLRMCGFIQ